MEGRGPSLGAILEFGRTGQDKQRVDLKETRRRKNKTVLRNFGTKSWRAQSGVRMMGLPLHAAPEPAWSEIWTAVLDRLRLECGQGIFDTWIAPLSLASAADGHVHLSAPRRLVRDYVA